MQSNDKPLVSICIPHWQVKELVTVCLRAIRKYTKTIPYEVIVVDNGSEDESLDYLRSLSWIRLIERGKQTPEKWVKAFTTALNVGLENSKGTYFLIMHTDTIVKNPQWLERLTAPLDSNPSCAAVGAWKLEPKRPFYDFFKKIADTKKAKLWFRRTFLHDPGARQLKREICPRDYCTLYRAEPIKRFNLSFCADGQLAGYTAGEQMYYQLKEKGYCAEVMNTDEMMNYVIHLAHATAGLRPEQRHLNHRRAQRKSERKLHRFFSSDWVKDLSEDSSIDR